MSRQVGLWIDHRKAVLVSLAEGGEAIVELESHMEKHIRPAGGARSKSPYGPQDVMKEDSRERKFKQHLKRWYDQVAEQLAGADEVLVFGPGEAKVEFHRHIGSSPLASRIVGVETVDKMTNPQIAAKVRQHFLKPDPLLAGKS